MAVIMAHVKGHVDRMKSLAAGRRGPANVAVSEQLQSDSLEVISNLVDKVMELEQRIAKLEDKGSPSLIAHVK